jgi:quercetin dioxygenase-like cupin family protein
VLANPSQQRRLVNQQRSIASSMETVGMQKISLEALARQQMKLAATAGGRHTADTVYGGHEKVLRQTVIGMVAGARLAEHENPGEATALILHGRVRLSVADLSWEAGRGDLLIMPENRHSLAALEDSAVLLTVAKLS